MSEIPVQLVDEDDNPIGGGLRDEFHKKGIRHRVSRVMIEDEGGNILIQKRTPNMPIYPNCWDTSVAGHVDEGESHLEAAQREVAEEIGIKDIALEEVSHYKTDNRYGWRILKRWNRLYEAVIPRDTELNIQPLEITEVKWVTRAELKELVKQQPNDISDGLMEAYEIMYKS